MDLAPDTVAWIESLTGGAVVGVERQGRWRPHFFVDVELPNGDVLPLLLRLERDHDQVAKSVFLSHFDLAHEAKVLEALQSTAVLTPKYYGFYPELPAILMQRLPGTNDLSSGAEAERGPILREYIDNLALLHSLTVDDMDLPGMSVPLGPEALALQNKFQYSELEYAAVRDGLRPEPLLDFAVWWLHHNVPKDRHDASWVQGDTGPGQFMFDAGHVTALIDWELGHMGDPMLDLGNMRVRNMLYPVGELGPLFSYYEQVTGSPINRAAVCFYTVMSTALISLTLAETVQTPDPSVDTMAARFGWDVSLRRGLCDALCEASGVEVDPPALPEPLPPARSDLHQFLVSHLESSCMPIAREEFDQFLMRSAVGVARTVALEHRLGPQFEAADLHDMEAVLGVRPSGREDGMAALSEMVAEDPAGNAEDLLWLFSRMEHRREHLWTPLLVAAAQKSEPLVRIVPATRRLEGPSRGE